MNCVFPLSYQTERMETENSLSSRFYWFILYCLRFMNYCKLDGVSHDTATGFLNQADRLIIELWERRRRSMDNCTIPDPGGRNITQHSQWWEGVAPELRLHTVAGSITHVNEKALASQWGNLELFTIDQPSWSCLVDSNILINLLSHF